MRNQQPSKREASVELLGRKHKVEVWSALMSHNVEPPEVFYVTGVHRQVIRETDSNLAPKDVAREIDDFEAFGMIERVDTPEELHASTKAYRCVASSPGWLMVGGVVEAFNAWYDEP
jgi:hypothetical protein